MGDLHWFLASFAADQIVEELKPFCDRIEVAGSIRRRKSLVKDVEILCIPKPGIPGATQEQMFSANAHQIEDVPDQVMSYLAAQLDNETPDWFKRLNKKGNPIGFAKRNRMMERRWSWRTGYTGTIPGRVAVDVFTASTQTWWFNMVLRTGAKEFNRFASTRAIDLGMKLSVAQGGLLKDGELLVCDSEQEYFDLLQIDYQKPTERNAEWVRKMSDKR